MRCQRLATFPFRPLAEVFLVRRSRTTSDFETFRARAMPAISLKSPSGTFRVSVFI